MSKQSATTLYAWATPAGVNGSPVDHTWVTAYDNQKTSYPNVNAVIAAKQLYWFCWGSFHPAGGIPGNPTGALGSQKGVSALATCLVTPNADSRHNHGARGTIFIYGVDGVCHQLANQVLYATGLGGPPLTVSRSRGYGASVFVYGTYGLQHAAWTAKKGACGVLPSQTPTSSQPSGGSKGPMRPDPDDFETQARSVLGAEPELLAALLSLKTEVQRFAAQAIPGSTPPRADFLNVRNQHLIDQAAALLGSDRFERIFGYPPQERINLVDPAIAAGR